MRLSILAILFVSILAGLSSLAAIPKSSMILQRTAENSGLGIYQIDLELQFPNGQEVTVIKESWMIEDQNNMKVHISGTKDYKEAVSIFINIQNGIRTFGKDSRKASSDLVERYFHTRSAEALNTLLAQEKMIPAAAHLQKSIKNLKDVDNSSEPYVRLARTNGVVTYAFGVPAEPEAKDQIFPGMWIEQDQFVIRKFRLNSGVEISADKYSSFPLGLNYPRTRALSWNGQQVIIQTLGVVAKNKSQFEAFGQKLNSKTDSLSLLPNAAFIEDFYKRFR